MNPTKSLKFNFIITFVVKISSNYLVKINPKHNIPNKGLLFFFLQKIMSNFHKNFSIFHRSLHKKML